MESKDRSRLSYMLGYAARRPRQILPYARRLTRDSMLRLRSRDHVGYYRAVMRSDTAKNPYGAVGTPTRERWLALGQYQFDYLVKHGLTRQDRLLEIGCGNLRAGWRFIEYLEPQHYYGIDISPDILFAGQDTLCEFKLQEKLPHLTPVRGLTLDFLPEGHFQVVHAHSVFSHCPIEVVEECLAHVGRVLDRDGFFDFTYNETTGAEHHVLWEDYYYRTEHLIELAGRYGLSARKMTDWSGNKQSKLRVTHR
jgi:SAM-dependent methyltransferase